MPYNRFGYYEEKSDKSPNTPHKLIKRRKYLRRKIQRMFSGAIVVFDHGECFVDVGGGFQLYHPAPLLRRPDGKRRPDDTERPRSAKERMGSKAWDEQQWAAYKESRAKLIKPGRPTPEPKPLFIDRWNM